MEKKPIIGIAGNIFVMEGGQFPGLERAYVNNDYVKSVELCGGNPVMIPVNQGDLGGILQFLDGIILSGGYDIVPELYGEEPIPQQGAHYGETDYFYMNLLKLARQMRKPVLGICKGIQAINVAFGGTLFQDLATQKEGALKHSQEAPRNQPSHGVSIRPDTFLATCFPEQIRVNSFHHQAVKDVAEGFRVAAVASDGVIEAIEYEGDSFIVGIQWHPEMMASFGDVQMQELFWKFMENCGKEVHADT